MIPHARLAMGRRWAILPPFAAAVAFWMFRHALADVNGFASALAWSVLGASVLWHLSLAASPHRFLATPRQEEQLRKLFVTVNVPVYNEDVQTLRLVVCSIFGQTRLPNRIEVVVNGPAAPDYSAVIAEFKSLAAFHPQIQCSWIRTMTPGKRNAQGMTFNDGGQADIFVTVDSDTILSPTSIQEGLKPFTDPKITSVAAVMITYNAGHNFLTRLTDVWFTTFQTFMRAAWSRLGCVLVNSGCLSFYRADAIRPALNAYTRELFLGRPVEFSDDSLLTLFALLKGRTVQQPTAFAFMVMPEKLSHHFRQQVRWYRGSFIRSWWRFKYLPLRSVAYWEHLLIWVTFSLAMALFTGAIIMAPILHHKAPDGAATALALVLTYAAASGFLLIQREGQSWKRQLLTFLLIPLTGLWTMLVLRPLRMYAILTCRNTGWGTREDVEVGLTEKA